MELGGSKILVAKEGDAVYASSNKCSHLGISLQGKTALLDAKVSGGCVTCSAHGTVFGERVVVAGGEGGEKVERCEFSRSLSNVPSWFPHPPFFLDLKNGGKVVGEWCPKVRIS